ncbi:hypothetical protein NLJ89_g3847 [Agrocybe chaxingu]|uniref:Uncharacterized protein n=1 Tax=Agrocybe chaxingu TaxID=84603 RepID=A0A9W8KAI2_9AGAR|nr:hypothetical protein NLJ89_g3847 [Agrocybe chaxingu]
MDFNFLDFPPVDPIRTSEGLSQTNYQPPAYSNAAYPHNAAGSSSLAGFAGATRGITQQPPTSYTEEVPLPLPGPLEPHIPATCTTTSSNSHSKVKVDMGRILKVFRLQPAIEQLSRIFDDRQVALAAAMLHLKFGLSVRGVRLPTVIYSDRARLKPGSVHIPPASLRVLSILCAQDPFPGFATITTMHGRRVSNNVFLTPEGVMYARRLILKLNETQSELRHRDPAAVERGTAALQRYMDHCQLVVGAGSAANQQPLSAAGTLPVPWKLASLRQSHPEAGCLSLPAEHSVAGPVVCEASAQQSQGDCKTSYEGQIWGDSGARDPGAVHQHWASTPANPFSGNPPLYITSQAVPWSTRDSEENWSPGTAMNTTCSRYIGESPQLSYASSLAGALDDSNAQASQEQLVAGATDSGESSNGASWCPPSATMNDEVRNSPYGDTGCANVTNFSSAGKHESFLAMLYADDIPDIRPAVSQAASQGYGNFQFF